MFKCFVLFISCALFIVGCASKNAFLNQDFAAEKIEIKATAAEVHIMDNRKSITDRRLKIPSLSLPGQRDKIEPTLTDSQIQMIKAETAKYFVGGNKTVIVNVTIFQGSQGFNAGWLREKETVEFEIGIDLLEANSKQLLAAGSGYATFEVKSIDASQGYTNKLFDKAIQTSIYKCLEKMARTFSN